MAGLIPVGSVVDPKRDVFPTTGAHADIRVIPQFGPNKGKKIDPKTARTLLQNVLVGPNRTPLVQQAGKDWKWNFPVTSGFGPRTAPTAGASTFHQGIDVSLGPGTQLTYKGQGTYRPDRGFGSLMTADPQGNPYEIRFLHTQPGKAASVGSTQAPSAPVLPSPEGTISPQQLSQQWAQAYMQSQYQNQERQGKLIDLLVDAYEKKKPKNFMEQMQESLMGGLMSNVMNPNKFLNQFINSEPYVQGQQYATSQFFGL